MFDSSGLFFDKEGNEISLEKWIELSHIPGYARVGLDKIGNLKISTIWLGTIYPGGATLETMVSDEEDIYVINRYKTEAEAKTGHDFWVQAVSEGWKPDDDN